MTERKCKDGAESFFDYDYDDDYDFFRFSIFVLRFSFFRFSFFVPLTPLLLKEGAGVVNQAKMQGPGVVKQARMQGY